MNKITLTICLLFVGMFTTKAQTSSATQSAKLTLSNAIEISFLTGRNTGPIVDLAFNTVNDYANGVESNDQQLQVKSNRRYNVTVNTTSGNFTFMGKAKPTPVMPVERILNMQLTMNKTGGKSGAAFVKGYGSLNEKAQDLLTDCDNGGSQMFNVMYKATPGFEYPEGVYTVDVVYTATQS